MNFAWRSSTWDKVVTVNSETRHSVKSIFVKFSCNVEHYNVNLSMMVNALGVAWRWSAITAKGLDLSQKLLYRRLCGRALLYCSRTQLEQSGDY